MPSREVEFRLLQFVTNVAGDERVTVGLLHWDGGTFRTAWAPDRIPSEAPAGESARELVRALRADAAERPPVGQAPLGGLAEVYPVRSGHGSLLFWDTLRQGWATHGERDFEVLAEALELRPSRDLHAPVTPLRPRRARFRDELARLGRSLADRLDPARIVVDHEMVGLARFRSPISWMNGRWHHSYPLSLKAPKPRAIAGNMKLALSAIVAAVPKDEVGVVVAQAPLSAVFQDGIGNAKDWFERELSGRVELVHIVSGPGSDGLRSFAERIEHDVCAAELRH